MPRYRTFSDTALSNFTEALDGLGIPYTVRRHFVETGGHDVDELGQEFGVERVKGNKGDNRKTRPRN
jgi:hypothetical protein